MKPVPKYKRITDALTKALDALETEFGPPQDVWLTAASSSVSVFVFKHANVKLKRISFSQSN